MFPLMDKIVHEPIYPEFAPAEYRDRYERLLAAGRRRGIDAFVFTDEQNLRYFAGGPLTDAFVFRNDYMAAVIPTDPAREPEFVLSQSRWNATGSSWISRKRLWGGGIASAGDATLDAILSSLRDYGLERSVVAWEIDTHEKLFMPTVIFDGLRELLPGMQVVSPFDVLMEIKSSKSPAELDCLRAACRITTEAIEFGMSTIRAGHSEKDVIRAIKAEMFRLGADSIPFLTVIAGWTGRSICWDSHATDYAIRPGDPIQIDGGCAIQGYTADMVRTASLGPLRDDRYLQLYDLAVKAHEAVRDHLQAGAIIHDVCSAGRDYLVQAGVEELLVFGEGQTGHGIGLNLHEAPFLDRSNHQPLPKSAVVAIEPALLEHADLRQSRYFTIVENNYVVTTSGYEQLTNSPNEIRVV